MSNIFRKEKSPPKWCPGCGDYIILNSLQKVCEEVGLKPHNTVIVSGIGCSSRLPYHFNSFGYHTIHGRAPTIATGLSIARKDLNIIVVTGDGDGLSIGLSHLIHTLRKNINLTILLFNNEIYGLTKGQHSPTSRLKAITTSTPKGSSDYPLNSIQIAIASNASFIARAADFDRLELNEILKAAITHQGASFVEILQNCIVFNDQAYLDVKENRLKIIDKRLSFSKTKGVCSEQVASLIGLYKDEEIGDDHKIAFNLTISDQYKLITGIFLKKKRNTYLSLKKGESFALDLIKKKINK